ncbi:putative n-glycosylase dna lyase protein [Botrytis fragariae]|uniref:Probable endonuclease LCL3 n=1 Tax=Botrytis fragariae TaxID=1964551 RepID=A0A8H6AXK6_9HELO|nr:putative n-glycosylase dna lyase protein [Botrytis fragariae]KAF5875421.1 putative n-glycosylase dna lyase protein [Botrytis fragariae]
MGNLRISEWRKLPVSLAELCIDTTLRCGQSFRWKKAVDEDYWSCTLHGRIISLKQDSTHLHYRTTFPEIKVPLNHQPLVKEEELEDEDDTESLLRHYLNLSPNLTELYEQWSSVDPNFKKRAPKFTGVRILKQDAWEALVGFICSSNNNIIRISQMVNNLCLHYGPLIGHIDDQPFHDFPQPEALTGSGVESHLRVLGFGYRARYIAQTASIVASKPKGWLENLRNPETFDKPFEGEIPAGGRPGYRKAHEELLELQGVGPKVADCVCLMGLGWGEAVPVDTHVWQIAQRDYKFGKGKHKSLTKATYDAIGDHFRGLWGKEAGWAHSVLFAADLKAFSDKLVSKVEVKVDELEIKQEDGDVLEKKVAVKREYPPEEMDLKEEEKVVIKREGVTEEIEIKDEVKVFEPSARSSRYQFVVSEALGHFQGRLLAHDGLSSDILLRTGTARRHYGMARFFFKIQEGRKQCHSVLLLVGDNLNATDWQHYTDPRTLIPTILLTTTILVSTRFYRSYLRRIPEAAYIRPGFFRKRSLLAGWGWMPGRKKLPEGKDLKNKTIHVRIAGVDAPEGAHFGKPAQPFSAEALTWLRNYIQNRRVRAYIYKRDQYDRVVATVWVRRFLVRKDVGREMLRAGMATVYEAKMGAEFGDFEAQYRALEEEAKRKKLGMWSGKEKDYESPRDYKTRTANAANMMK